jgi:hypothetical protein
MISPKIMARIGQPAFTHGVDAGGVQKVGCLGAGLAPDRPDLRLGGSHLAHCRVSQLPQGLELLIEAGVVLARDRGTGQSQRHDNGERSRHGARSILIRACTPRTLAKPERA